MRDVAPTNPEPASLSGRAEPTSDRSTPSDRLPITLSQVCHPTLPGGGESMAMLHVAIESAGVTLLRSTQDGNAFRRGETLAISVIRTLVGRRGPDLAREVLAALARTELAPITADHIRVAEVFLCEEEYWGAFDAARVTQAFRSLSPQIMTQVRELAAARHWPTWRALEATMYHRFSAPLPGAAMASAVKASSPSDVPDLDRAPPRPPAPAKPRRCTKPRTFDALGHTVRPSPALAAVVGAGPMLRTDAIAALSRYIDVHGLNDPADRHVIRADAKLRAVFGRDRVPVSELGRIWSQEPQVA